MQKTRVYDDDVEQTIDFSESIRKVMGSASSPFDIINMSQTSHGPAALRYNADQGAAHRPGS